MGPHTFPLVGKHDDSEVPFLLPLSLANARARTERHKEALFLFKAFALKMDTSVFFQDNSFSSLHSDEKMKSMGN